MSTKQGVSDMFTTNNEPAASTIPVTATEYIAVVEAEKRRIVPRPTSVRIGTADYRIEWMDGNWSAGSVRYGECAYTTQVIRINADRPPMAVASTFIHEITHAIADWYGLDDGRDYSCECLATTIGAMLPMVWRDNPAAFEWWQSLIAGDNNGSE